MITAHSGCDGTAMNTMEYLQHACSLSIDALEIDIRRGTGGLVLTHDPVGKKPLLAIDEALEFLRDKSVRINCDLKEYGLEEDLLVCAKKYGMKDRIILTGAITDCMVFHKNNLDVEVFINAEELIPDFYSGRDDIDNLINLCKLAGYHVINIDYRMCDLKTKERCRETGIGLSVWTVDDPHVQRQFRDVYNLTTNNIAAAILLAAES